MASKSNIQDYNDSKVFISPTQHNLIKILRNDGPKTRRELVIQIKTPRTTVYDNLIKLQKRKVVEKFLKNSGKRGRPIVFWRLKEEA